MQAAEYDELVGQITEAIWQRVRAPLPAGGGACAACGGACRGSCGRGLIDSGACRLSVCPPAPRLEDGIAAFIDHTLLKPEATREQIEQVCAEAREYGFASVCVNPCWLAVVTHELRGTPVLACAVVGFPLGATTASAKRAEAAEALKLGADELDMVMNIGALKSGMDAEVEADIRGVVELAHSSCARVKVILETALLAEEEKVRACRLAQRAGADFVKTSTGFGPGGATPADVALMRATVGDCMGVKAAGGVRTYEDLLKMVGAGASRVGASASVKILAGQSAPASPGAAAPAKASGY